MTQALTPAHYGTRILQLYKAHHRDPQAHFLSQVLRLSLLTDTELLPEVLLVGLQWLIDQGYLQECGPWRASYELTPEGVAALSGH